MRRAMPTPDKVALTGVMLVLVSLAFGNFLVFRPSRISAGAGLLFLQAVPAGEELGAVLLTAGLTAASMPWGGHWTRDRAARTARTLGRLRLALACVLLLLLAWSAGSGAAAVLAGQPDQARASLGTGFWGACFGLLGPVVDAARRRERGDLLPVTAVLGLAAGLAGLLASGHLDGLSVLRELAGRRDRFWDETSVHLLLSGSSAAAGSLLGIPLGLAAHRMRRFGEQLFFVLSIVQTIPSLALFGLLIAPLAFLAESVPVLRSAGVQGIGWAPAFIALTLYGLLPVVRNTFVGLRAVDRGVVEAGLGMGMSRLQLLRRVELPLAMPVIIGGIRVALVQNIGNTAVAALIGAGGLGSFIFQGLGQSAMDLVLLGALPTVVLAVLADSLMQGAAALAAPKGAAR